MTLPLVHKSLKKSSGFPRTQVTKTLAWVKMKSLLPLVWEKAREQSEMGETFRLPLEVPGTYKLES